MTKLLAPNGKIVDADKDQIKLLKKSGYLTKWNEKELNSRVKKEKGKSED